MYPSYVRRYALVELEWATYSMPCSVEYVVVVMVIRCELVYTCVPNLIPCVYGFVRVHMLAGSADWPGGCSGVYLRLCVLRT